MADSFACEAEHLKIYLWAKSQLLQGDSGDAMVMLRTTGAGCVW